MEVHFAPIRGLDDFLLTQSRQATIQVFLPRVTLCLTVSVICMRTKSDMHSKQFKID
jgi:hypothetical protein